MSKSREQSIKQKLKNLSKEKSIPFNSLLDTLFLERFLARVSHSKYVDQLIFKGGLCLAQYIDLGRETRDIDFLITKIDSEKKNVEEIIREVAGVNLGDDCLFNFESIIELSIEHKKYPGYRITLRGSLGQIKNKVSIDIGVGDVVRPKFLELELMKSGDPLFEDKINLHAYPPEYIFSEKVEAILYHGALSSRMKDFYDCYRMIDAKLLDMDSVQVALVETCRNRNTKIKLISTETDVFKDLWKNFCRAYKLVNIDMDNVVAVINKVLKNLLKKTI